MPPFDEAVAYAHPDWWNPYLYGIDDRWYVRVPGSGAEVARIELNEVSTSSTTRMCRP